MKYEIIFFDFDGTLVDTLPDITSSANAMLHFYGYPSVESKDVVKYVGSGAKYLVSNCFKMFDNNLDDIFFDKALAYYIDYYNAHCTEKADLYEGVIETLTNLKSIKIIYTNKPLKITKSMVEKMNIEKYFEKIIAPETYNIRKPDPKPIFLISKEYNIPIDKMILIGDSKYDIDCAKNANIASCAVTYGYSTPNEIKEADFIIDNFRELEKIL